MRKKKVKRLLSLILTILLVIGLFPAVGLSVKASAGADTSGNWSDYAIAPSLSEADKTYTISSAENLAWVADQVNSDTNTFHDYTFNLTKDIDLSAHYWTPIGLDGGAFLGLKSKCFRGTFNGNGNAITGLRIGTASNYETAYRYIGLFGLTSSAVIRDVNVEDAAIYATFYQGDLGGIAGCTFDSEISGCSFSGTLKGKNVYFAGGLIGWVCTGSVTKCHTAGALESTDIDGTGGLVGQMGWAPAYVETKATITDSDSECQVTGHNTSSGTYAANAVGGCIGEGMWFSASGCHATGNLSGDGPKHEEIGGFIGHTSGYLAGIDHCYATGNVTCYYGYTGGFLGSGTSTSGVTATSNDYIRNCGAWGTVTCTSSENNFLGGFVGTESDKTKIENCFARGDVVNSSAVYMGAFVGSAIECSVTNCYSSGSIRSGRGFVGYATSASFSNCYYNSSKCNTASGATGLTNKVMRANSGVSGALVDLLNEQAAKNSWTTWTVKNDSYPVFNAADQAAPTDLGTIHPASESAGGGQITNTDPAMEYILSTSTDDKWTTVTGSSITDLAAGTYYVRYAEKPGFYPSITAEVVLSAAAQNSAKEITSFSVGIYTGTINQTSRTISVTVPYGTDVKTLVPTFQITGESVSPERGVTQNFTTPVIYTVTAENGAKRDYTVTVNVASDTRSSAKAITSFKIGSVDGTINEADHTIAVIVPYGTDVTKLSPAITVSDKASVSPASGEAKDFTSPVTYTVKAENETTQTYTVTVTVEPDAKSSAKAITGFKIGSVDGTINEVDHTIAVKLPYGTDVTKLSPAITVSDKASVSPASGEAKDFTSPVAYMVTAENGTTQPYTVTVTVAPDTRSSAKAITSFKIGSEDGTINETDHTIAVTLPYGTDVTNLTPAITVSDKASISPASGAVQNFTNPVTYTVKAENETTQTYTVTVTVEPDTKSSAKAITGFKIGSVDGTINEVDHTIAVKLPYGTDVTKLSPAIMVSDKASVSPASGEAKDFTSPVTYTVKAENETTQTYTITVTVEPDTKSNAKAITGFKIGSVDGTINEVDHTIAVKLPYGTDVTKLSPAITVSDKASVSPTTAQNFTNPVTYTVTAENGTTQPYTVTVTVAPDTRSSAKAITGFKIGSVDGTINEAEHTIAVKLPYGTDVTKLSPVIMVSDKASVSPTTAQNFTSPVTYTVKAENETKQTYTVTVTPVKSYSITLDKSGIQTFSAQTAGYSSISPLSIKVTNTGNQATGALTVSLSGTNASSFTLSKSTMGSIAKDGSDTFTIKPNDSLAAGTYTATVTVSGGNGISQSFTVSFTVNKATSGGGGSGGGSSAGGGSSSTTTNNSSITVTTDSGTTTAAQAFTATTGSSGVAAASVTREQIADLVKAATEKAQNQNTQPALEIKIDSSSTASGVSLTIPQGAASALTNGVDALTISSPAVSVTFDDKALAAINKNKGGDITITARKPSDTEISDQDKAIIGSRPIYDLKISSGSTAISSFGDGTATVSIPYTPTSGEDTNKIVVYYITGGGELVMVPNCIYDASSKTVTFVTKHFSSYAVGYHNVSFTDVSGWYADYVDYLAARKIIDGTDKGTFSPDANITRAQFAAILARMSGDDLSGDTSSSFSDVMKNDWYCKAVQWAYKNGVAAGSDGKFDPNANITREQMAVMLYHYAKYMGMDISKVEGASIQKFSDYESVSKWAISPIQWAISNNIVSGNSDGSFAPQANATRAQASKMVAIFIQSIVK